MVAGYLAGNIDKNVEIPGGIRLFFKRSGATVFSTFGDLADISATPLAEFLDFFSAYDGKPALAKKILQNRSLTIDATLNEVTTENMRLAFFASALTAGSINIPAVVSPKRVGNTFTLAEGAAVDAVIEVRSEDGATLYVVSTDYTVALGVITVVGSSSLDTDIAEGQRANVLYDVVMASADTQVMEILDETTIEGTLQFHVLNADGGLAQILVVDSVHISPNGAIPYGTDAPQTIVLSIAAQIVAGKFGRMYFKTVT